MSEAERHAADPACRRVLDHLTALVRVWTPRDGVVYVNRAWRDLTGTSLEDNLGDGWLDVVHDEDRAAVLVAFGAAGKPGPVQYRLSSTDGQTVIVNDVPSTATDEHGTGVVEVVHTIVVRDTETGSRQTMSKWAHELRGPLNAILGWSDLLGTGASDSDVLQRGLKAIANNARQQAQIIKRMAE